MVFAVEFLIIKLVHAFIFLALLFLITIIYSLRTLKRAKIKIDFAFVIYSLFYLAVFPILLIISIYYWARGYSEW